MTMIFKHECLKPLEKIFGIDSYPYVLTQRQGLDTLFLEIKALKEELHLANSVSAVFAMRGTIWSNNVALLFVIM